MRISELAERSEVALPTIKYYLREGLLMPGVARNATQADYGDEHLRRLRVIRALSDAAGLPIQKIKIVIGLIDEPRDDLYATLGAAVSALPPYVAAPEDPDAYAHAREVLERLGQVYDPHFAAVAQLDTALAAAEDAGIPMTDDRLTTYARHLRAIAAFDLAHMPAGSSESAVEYAVLGTALYEPIVLAMRRLAHQDLAARTLTRDDDENVETRPAP